MLLGPMMVYLPFIPQFDLPPARIGPAPLILCNFPLSGHPHPSETLTGDDVCGGDLVSQYITRIPLLERYYSALDR